MGLLAPFIIIVAPCSQGCQLRDFTGATLGASTPWQPCLGGWQGGRGPPQVSKGKVKTGHILTNTLQALGIDHFLAPNLGAGKSALIVAIPLQVIKVAALIVGEFEVANALFASLALKVKGGRIGVVVIDNLGTRHGADGADATGLIEHGADHVVHLSGGCGGSGRLTHLL